MYDGNKSGGSLIKYAHPIPIHIIVSFSLPFLSCHRTCAFLLSLKCLPVLLCRDNLKQLLVDATICMQKEDTPLELLEARILVTEAHTNFMHT